MQVEQLMKIYISLGALAPENIPGRFVAGRFVEDAGDLQLARDEMLAGGDENSPAPVAPASAAPVSVTPAPAAPAPAAPAPAAPAPAIPTPVSTPAVSAGLAPVTPASAAEAPAGSSIRAEIMAVRKKSEKTKT
jgi:hypothetical protein